MITIKNRLLLNTLFWEALTRVMEDKTLAIKVKLQLVVIKRQLTQAVEDVQEAGKSFERADQVALMKVTSQIDSAKIEVDDKILEKLSANDMLYLEDIITLEG